MKIQGNTILVAGGAGGIGRGLAELLCRLGNEVIIFGGQPAAMSALVRANPGMRTADLDLADPWHVAAFAEQIRATHPGLNMLVNISIAFPVRYLPGMGALLDDDDTPEKLEAHRLGVQHLTGTLLPHFRQQARSAVMNVSAGPLLAPPMAPAVRAVMDGSANASTVSVRKRWASASVELIDVSRPSRAERMSPDFAARPGEMPLPLFASGVAHVLAQGLHEEAAIEGLRALWPVAQPAAGRARDDLAEEAY